MILLIYVILICLVPLLTCKHYIENKLFVVWIVFVLKLHLYIKNCFSVKCNLKNIDLYDSFYLKMSVKGSYNKIKHYNF